MDRLTQLRQMLSEDPNDAFLLFAIAKEHEKADNLKEALNSYLELREKAPDYLGMYYHLGGLYNEVDQKEEALKIYDEGIALAQSQKDLHALAELKNARVNCELS